MSGNLFNPLILGFGAGISNAGSLSLSNVTITDNANSGGGVGGGAGIHLNGGSVRVRNSIIAAQAVGTDCDSGVTTDGYNIDSDGTCGLVDAAGGGTDQPSVADAGLLPLGETADLRPRTTLRIPARPSTAAIRRAAWPTRTASALPKFR